MDARKLFEKTILIRITDEGDGFVSTVRYGAIGSRSDTWKTGAADEEVRESSVRESPEPGER